MVRWLKAVLMHHTSYLASVSLLHTGITACDRWHESSDSLFVDACLTCTLMPSVQTHTLHDPNSADGNPLSTRSYKHTQCPTVHIPSLSWHSYLILFNLHLVPPPHRRDNVIPANLHMKTKLLQPAAECSFVVSVDAELMGNPISLGYNVTLTRARLAD